MELFTIGHSNHDMNSFIALLQQHGVTAIADVRSQPYSRFLPQYNREALQKILDNHGIKYVFLGRELGARPSNPDCYVEGKAVYEKIANTDLFHEGVKRVQKGLQKHKISLLCAEKDPLTCHRAILVCQQLRHLKILINHILNNGDLESHDQLEERMLIKHNFTNFSEAQEAQLSIFVQNGLPTREECLQEAYKLRGSEIAYIEKREQHHEESDQTIYNRVHSKERTTVL
ncbi:DUF488 domain-containing protein [Thermosynechococcaceae cyanobacterium BACA0444]|uniref:DUF488 domain-containing protein n=1 Tax=Pseudocalidococcus azoricus BACA0444 TaxID=2918990 RepID=A0AAE4FSZ9_9CYAN|nr:DUF488 domain-containing protein [Pseudocalidococcus azoricus]MDS3861650.1 DUF488 domain-containing protein [Pseudocalidococcus azoricus BACA0444]